MPRPTLRWLLAMLVTSLTVTPTAVQAARSPIGGDTSPATAAIQYIESTQSFDGGFFGAGQPAATSGGLADTLVASAVDTGLSDEAEAAALDRLAQIAPSATTRPAYTGRIVMAIVATGGDPSAFGGVDYASRLAESRNVAGWWEPQNYANALAALGWAALGHALPLESIAWMKANQCADGGWGFQTACLSTSDVDTTALMINALIAGGVTRDDPTMTRARQFLVLAQNDAGGFGDRPNAETNSNSTGLALSAIAALGDRPDAAPWNLGEDRNPLAQLLALQTADGGFLWMASQPSLINNYATVQATPGVAGVAYPVRPSASSGRECPPRSGRRVGQCPDRHPALQR